jgi:hypothetical protein
MRGNRKRKDRHSDAEKIREKYDVMSRLYSHLRVHGGLCRNTVTYVMNRVPAPEAAEWGGPVEEQFKYIIYAS